MYFPSRLGRVSIVPGMKSGACRSRIAMTSCVKPLSLRPMILIGNAVGKASAAAWGGPFTGASGGLPFLSRTHDLLLEFLVERVDAAEQRTGLAAGHRLAVERHYGEHFLRLGGYPDLVGAPHLGFAHVAVLQRHARGLRDLGDHLVGDAWQDQVRLGRRQDHAVADHE